VLSEGGGVGTQMPGAHLASSRPVETLSQKPVHSACGVTPEGVCVCVCVCVSECVCVSVRVWCVCVCVICGVCGVWYVVCVCVVCGACSVCV